MTLNQILTQVAEGKLSVADAAWLIRQNPPRRRRRQMTFISALVFFIVGAVFASIGLNVGAREWWFASSAQSANGTVIKLVNIGGRGSAPLVRYEVDGKPFEVQSQHSASPPTYKVGQKVTVHYQPEHPDDARLKSGFHLWGMPGLFIAFGGLLMTFGVGIALNRLFSPGTFPEPETTAARSARDVINFVLPIHSGGR